jgi:hypothetical protein
MRKAFMQISEILNELETLLEQNNLDECWSDWLRDFAERTAVPCDDCDRIELLREILNSENALSKLSSYLPEKNGSENCPERELSSLIRILDTSVREELGE